MRLYPEAAQIEGTQVIDYDLAVQILKDVLRVQLAEGTITPQN